MARRYPSGMECLRIAGAQINLTVGDLEGNKDRILDAMGWAEGVGADILLLPELAITGYPPEDLVLRPEFVRRNREVLDELAARSERVVTVVGFVDNAEGDGGFEYIFIDHPDTKVGETNYRRNGINQHRENARYLADAEQHHHWD